MLRPLCMWPLELGRCFDMDMRLAAQLALMTVTAAAVAGVHTDHSSSRCRRHVRRQRRRHRCLLSSIILQWWCGCYLMFPFVCFLCVYVLCFHFICYVVNPFFRLSSFTSFPSTWQCIAFACSQSLSICDTCPNHFNLLSPILSISVVSWCSIPHTISFLLSSRLVTFNSLLNHAISAMRTLLSSSFLKNQHSEPYNCTGTMKVSYTFTLVLFEMLYDLHSLLNLFTIAEVRPIVLFTFFMHFSSAVIT